MQSDFFVRPKITVITVVFNGRDFIERTILSVIGQTYSDIEYIVIDGGSTDGTLDVIKKYESEIDYFCSESDSGIYDAMNKGLSRATGHWVNFMNAGDTFHDTDSIAELFSRKKQCATIIYGAVEIVYPDLVRVQVPGFKNRVWQGMQFCHQSAFVDVDYHKAHPFNIANKIAADLEFFYNASLDGAEFLRTDKVISRVITGGVSERNRIKTIMASCNAVCGGKFRPFIRMYYLGRVITTILRSMVKKILPRTMVRWFILLK